MAPSNQRRVKRSGSGRDAIVNTYGKRPWYALPYWAVQWLADSSWWLVLSLVVLLTPIALLGLVLGANSLPLNYLGIPSTAKENSLGLAAVVFLFEFGLLAAAIRPLKHQRRLGWYLVITAAVARLAHSIVLEHAISGFILTLLPIYIYTQVRKHFS